MTMTQRRLLPSISMLAAFDAAARTNSFTAAAKTLDLSQGAISRQIRALEVQLGIDLFIRDRQSVALSEAGKTYAAEIHSALNIIRQASRSLISGPFSGALKLAILPTFGTRWLIPRLPTFLAESPGVTVDFFMKVVPFDFAGEDLHAAIHYGLPDWPGAECTFIMDEQVTPVCSALFKQTHGLERPEDFLDVPLLHISTRSGAWDEWFQSFGIRKEAKHGMHFDQFASTAQAAVAGLGVALLPTFLIENELDSDVLVHAMERTGERTGENTGERNEESTVKSSRAYYFVTPHALANDAPVTAFRDWLVRQVKYHYQM